MSGKNDKRTRRSLRKQAVSAADEARGAFASLINGMPLWSRIKIAFKIIIGKL